MTDETDDPYTLLHDNGFSWDDVNAIASILAHYGLEIVRGADPTPPAPTQIGDRDMLGAVWNGVRWSPEAEWTRGDS